MKKTINKSTKPTKESESTRRWQVSKSQYMLRALFILFVCVGIVFGLELLYTSFVLEQKIDSRKELMYQEYRDSLDEKKIDVLIMGDSIARAAARPDVITNVSNLSVYNLGADAENYAETYYRLRRVVEQDNLDVEVVLLELQILAFYQEPNRNDKILNRAYVHKNYMSYGELADVSDSSIAKVFAKVHLNFVGKIEEYYYVSLLDEPEMLINGWGKRTTAMTPEELVVNAETNIRGSYLEGIPVTEETYWYFIETVKLAQRNNIDVVFVTYPYSQEYEEALEKYEVDRDGFFTKTFERIDTDMGVERGLFEYERLDYTDMFFDESQGMFSDANHLNVNSSLIFSERLGRDLVSLEE